MSSRPLAVHNNPSGSQPRQISRRPATKSEAAVAAAAAAKERAAAAAAARARGSSGVPKRLPPPVPVKSEMVKKIPPQASRGQGNNPNLQQVHSAQVARPRVPPPISKPSTAMNLRRSDSVSRSGSSSSAATVVPGVPLGKGKQPMRPSPDRRSTTPRSGAGQTNSGGRAPTSTKYDCDLYFDAEGLLFTSSKEPVLCNFLIVNDGIVQPFTDRVTRPVTISDIVWHYREHLKDHDLNHIIKCTTEHGDDWFMFAHKTRGKMMLVLNPKKGRNAGTRSAGAMWSAPFEMLENRPILALHDKSLPALS